MEKLVEQLISALQEHNVLLSELNKNLEDVSLWLKKIARKNTWVAETQRNEKDG